jgi:UDP-glucose 4-epimerase
VNAVVTGGAGFIGSCLLEALLKNGVGTTAFDDLSSGKRENVSLAATLCIGDVLDSRAVVAAVPDDVDLVFHLAAQIDVRRAVEDPQLDARVNIGGTINVLSACVQRHVRRFIMSSTGGALYGEYSSLPADERSAIQPLSPYGVSKYCAEQYVAYFGRTYGLDTVVLRYSNVYGPRQDPLGEAGVVGIFARRILMGQACAVCGDGEQTRDFVFVDDVAHANMLAADGPAGTFNIGTGVGTSINQLLGAFERVVGHAVAREHVPERAGEVRRIVLEASQARSELGWYPAVSLEDGIERTLEWVKERL